MQQGIDQGSARRHVLARCCAKCATEHGNQAAWIFIADGKSGIVNGAPRPNITAWIEAVGELRGLGGKTVHGGRGESAPVADAIADQQRYLKAIDGLVAKYVADLGPAAAELKDSAKAAAHHKAIQAKAEAELPGRALPYLIGYGVYGLANSKL